MTLSIHLNSAPDTHKLGRLIASCIKERAFLGLTGQLGAGKTTLTQGLAEELGIDEAVNSPTFLMLNEYRSGRLPLYHFDLYRLQEDLNTDSAAATTLKAELDELMNENAASIVVVEWIDLWEEFAPEYDKIQVELNYQSDSNGRSACLSASSQAGGRLLESVAAVCSLNGLVSRKSLS